MDHRADVFALGVILYELLTGKLSFEGRHSTEVLKATLQEKRIPLSHLNTLVTRPVGRLITRMIRKNPEGRPASMKEVVAECDRLIKVLHQDFSTNEQTQVQGALKEMMEG